MNKTLKKLQKEYGSSVSQFKVSKNSELSICENYEKKKEIIKRIDIIRMIDSFKTKLLKRLSKE